MATKRKTEEKKKESSSPLPPKTSSKQEKGMTVKELNHFEKILLKARETELIQLGLIEDDLDRTQVDSVHDLSAFPFHMADLGTDTASREKNSILVTAEGEVLYEIDQALRRIYDKTYGICESCGGLITKNRLEALPYARLCVSCQEKEEKAKKD